MKRETLWDSLLAIFVGIGLLLMLFAVIPLAIWEAWCSEWSELE